MTERTARIQVTLDGDAGAWLRQQADQHRISSAEVVRRSLELFALVDEMAPQEYLAVVNDTDNTMQAIEIAWHPRFARRLPTLKALPKEEP